MKRGRPPYDDILTPREWQVLDLLAEGLTNEEVAERLGISFGAAKYHVAEILSKLGAENRQAAVEIARRRKQGAVVALPVPLAWALGAAAVVAMLLLTGAFVVGRDETRRADLPPDAPAQIDEAQAASPFPNTLLLTKTTPVDVGTASETIASLRTVRTLAELKAALGPQINLIVVDQSAVGEIRGSDFVLKQSEAGRAFIGLNVCFAGQLHEKFGLAPTPYTGMVWETSPSGETRYFYPPGAPPGPCQMPIVDLPYFSFQVLPTGQQRQALGGRDSAFIGGATVSFITGSEWFLRVLAKLDAGERTRLMPVPTHCEPLQPDGTQRLRPCTSP